MVDNLAEKIDECPPNWGCYVSFVYNWECKKCPLYGVAGCLLFRGFYCIEIYGEATGTFRIIRYIVGVRDGCPLSGVSLYPARD